MHRSRFVGLIIDCKTDDLDAVADFWSAALGYPRQRESENDLYVGLNTPKNDPYIEVQKVDHPSRVHLDIETDDIEAEVMRLEALGARRVADVKNWCVMEAPSGQRFCIIPAESSNFATTANEWS
jgi:catechol 2,3-dioxygenase-like lactoylglutathione lyase family enzyme